MSGIHIALGSAALVLLSAIGGHAIAEDWAIVEDWLQFKFDARHSENVPHRRVTTPLGLIAAVPTTDAIQAGPVVAGRKYVVDGSGVAFCIAA